MIKKKERRSPFIAGWKIALMQKLGYTSLDGYSTGWRTAYKRAETVVYETVIGSDQLTELYRY